MTNRSSKETFEAEFLRHYLGTGNGALSKKDTDALVMYLLDKYGFDEAGPLYKYPNQDISAKLKAPVAKMKQLRYEAGLKYGGRVEDQAKARLLAAVSSAALDIESKKICLVIEDALAKNWLQGQLKNNGLIFDHSFNTEIIKVDMEPYTLLPCRTGRNDEFESLVVEVHRLFQAMADKDAEWSARDKEPQRSLAELDAETGRERRPERPPTAGLLSDLLPGWRPIFDDSAQVPTNVRRAAVAFFETRIRPKIAQQAATVVARARELLDVLELPFWRHRWHTYEFRAAIGMHRRAPFVHRSRRAARQAFAGPCSNSIFRNSLIGPTGVGSTGPRSRWNHHSRSSLSSAMGDTRRTFLSWAPYHFGSECCRRNWSRGSNG